MTTLDPNQLVGRTRELALIDNALDRLPESSACVIALTGEPGIGKTSVLDALRDRAEGRGVAVFHARSAEFEREAPFGVFVDALDDYLGSLNARRFDNLGSGERAELAAVFPSLAELSDVGARALPDERYRAHRAVASLLELLAQRGPVVLILDDLQWAGDASVELISHLLRRRPKGGVLLALAFRQSQAPPTLLAALGSDDLLELHPRDDVARELRRVGRRVPRAGMAGSAADGVGSLSARELEVAELVHQGRTNRQIAAALFLSERTVETHLTHSFRKLSVKGRTELAAAMERELSSW